MIVQDKNRILKYLLDFFILYFTELCLIIDYQLCQSFRLWQSVVTQFFNS